LTDKDTFRESVPRRVGGVTKLVETVNGGARTAKNNEGLPPLFQACVNRDVVSVAMLVAGGADVNEESRWGETPMHYAALRGDENMVAFLIDQSADVNKQDVYGRTPLHMACKRGQYGIAHLLLRSGSRVDAKDTYGLTPVDYASRLGADKRARGRLIGLLLDWQSSGTGHDEAPSGEVDETQGTTPPGM